MVYSQVPVFPKRPEPDAATAAGWIAHQGGRFTLTLPRAEIGQNITTALKQIACAELGADWDAVDVDFHDTAMARVKATVGSESMMLFAEPLAQACAALRDAMAEGRETGEVTVLARPVAELRALQKGGLIGASPQIAQGLDIVTGKPLYAADIARTGTLFGRVLRAPASVEVASRPQRWNASAAQALPGFVAIVEETGPAIGKAQGLGIVASTPDALNQITEALDVEWQVDGSPDRADVMAAIDIDTRLDQGALPHIANDGSPEDGSWDVNLRIDIPLAAHGSIEPRAAVAEWQGDALTIWTGTQDAFYVRDVLSDTFGVQEVVVQTMRVGGAFGGRVIATVELEAAALARAVKTPVKVQWTRAQEFALGYHRPPASHRIKARLAEGRVTDWDHGQVSSHIFFTSAVAPKWMQRATDTLIGDDGVARGMAAPYVQGRARATYDVKRLPVHTAAWRGLGAGPNALAIECAMDEAARVAGVDPLEFRLNHIDDTLLTGVLQRVAEIADWGTPPRPEKGLRKGRGIACGVYKNTSYAAVVADVRVEEDGWTKVEKLWCAHDCGLAVNPDQVRAQCEGNLAWSIGMILTDDLPLKDGFVAAEVFADAPIPRQSDVPDMVIDLVDSPRPPQGAGETAMVAGPAAIANAIRAATGMRMERLPLRQEDLAV
ncbi:molybdopterin cofactor-binding domain-containing protein [Pseudophaeobacter sp. 1A16562]|uniref:xanthine dehydrogenase family protein molybdopterin-binding subunit n=1 Tax=Pseudophaeobacter sp. 1A16562 TaxID=3098143 RepID=UPI0034D55DFA